MAYNLDLKGDSGYGFWVWRKALTSLSASGFERLYPYLDFPIPPTKDMQSIARDFSLTFFHLAYTPDDERLSWHRLMQSAENPLLNLLTSVTDPTPFSEKKVILLQNTLAEFDKLGVGEAIYTWGHPTHKEYEYKKARSNLFHFWLLLRAWAEKYGRFPTDQRRERHESDLPFSNALKEEIQAIVLLHEGKRQEFEVLLKTLDEKSYEGWNEFAHSETSVWNKHRGHFTIGLHHWQTLKALLSATQMTQLAEWINENKIHNRSCDGNLVLPPF